METKGSALTEHNRRSQWERSGAANFLSWGLSQTSGLTGVRNPDTVKSTDNKNIRLRRVV